MTSMDTVLACLVRDNDHCVERSSLRVQMYRLCWQLFQAGQGPAKSDAELEADIDSFVARGVAASVTVGERTMVAIRGRQTSAEEFVQYTRGVYETMRKRWRREQRAILRAQALAQPPTSPRSRELAEQIWPLKKELHELVQRIATIELEAVRAKHHVLQANGHNEFRLRHRQLKEEFDTLRLVLDRFQLTTGDAAAFQAEWQPEMAALAAAVEAAAGASDARYLEVEALHRAERDRGNAELAPLEARAREVAALMLTLQRQLAAVHRCEAEKLVDALDSSLTL